VECLDLFAQKIALVAHVKPASDLSLPLKTEGINSKLYPFQVIAVRQILQQRVRIVAFEMGLGKTGVAIEAMRLANVQRVCVVCPAVVRQHWLDELDIWWPNHPRAEIIEKGSELSNAPIIIISYALFAHIQERSFDFFVLDEAHYIKNSSAGRSKILKEWLSTNLGRTTKYCIALTATPITNEPKDLWHLLDCLWPGRFGKYWSFAFHYCQVEKNKYGSKVWGIQSSNSEELRQRFAAIGDRVTKHEVAHLLPKFTVLLERINLEKFFSSEDLEQHCNTVGKHKASVAVEYARLAKDAGVKHICILTHLRETAINIASVVKLGTVYHIDGEMLPGKRNEVIAEAKSQPQSIIVATMHSIGIGIDLTHCTEIIFAELYWQPAVIIQALGRFNRLSSSSPATVRLLVGRGTIDEQIAAVLRRKIYDAGEVLSAGTSDENLAQALESSRMTQEEMQANLTKCLDGYQEDGY
jgi:SWI/SNF-related matrix-associated actin-dependent regulator 1 of chromatin subfamily A